MRVAPLDGISEEQLTKFLPEAEAVSLEQNPKAIFVRSTIIRPQDLGPSLLAICRVGVDTNKIPVQLCSQKGIAVFNAPGANANSVKELVKCILVAASRNVIAALFFKKEWAKHGNEHSEIEKAKKEFEGVEILGKTILVVGLGAVGRAVADSCRNDGLKVLAFDPYAPDGTFENFLRVYSLEKVPECDFVTLHPALTPETRGMINGNFMKRLRPGTVLLNFARGELVDQSALLGALTDKTIRIFASDFYDELISASFPDRTIFLPHLGGSTREAQERALGMAAGQFRDFWRRGSVQNSVNFPRWQLEEQKPDTLRLAVANLNVPNMIGRISGILGAARYNISLNNKNLGEIGYTIVDIDNPDERICDVLAEISRIEGVTKVRAVKP